MTVLVGSQLAAATVHRRHPLDVWTRLYIFRTTTGSPSPPGQPDQVIRSSARLDRVRARRRMLPGAQGRHGRMGNRTWRRRVLHPHAYAEAPSNTCMHCWACIYAMQLGQACMWFNHSVAYTYLPRQQWWIESDMQRRSTASGAGSGKIQPRPTYPDLRARPCLVQT